MAKKKKKVKATKAKKKTTKKAAPKKAAKKTAKKAAPKAAKKAMKKAAPKKSNAKSTAASKTAPKAALTTAPKTSTSNVKVGEPLPDFTLEGTGGTQFHLADKKGKKVVLYFYPKDATPGCTIEGHDFSKLKSDFEAAGAEVYGISRDTLQSHENFKTKECYTVDLLSDADEKVCKIFDVIKDKNMYGKMVKGIERSTFVLDSEGRLAKEWRGVKVDGHAEEVLNAVKEIQ